MSVAYIRSLQIGEPETLPTPPAFAKPGEEPTWTSSIFKKPINDPVYLHKTHLEGDGQADVKNHGGADKAVLAYAWAHYAAWGAELGWRETPAAAFGENLTIDGQSEASVCLGDVFQIGGADTAPLVQVCQPRQPCWKQEQRLEAPGLIRRITETGRTGWYLRVLRPGTVHPGAPLLLEARTFPEFTIQYVNAIFYRQLPGDAVRDGMERLAACAAISANLRRAFLRRLS